MEQAPVTLRPALTTLARLTYLTGEQLVRVGPVAPDLATSLTSVAIAQTNFGHARYFYNWHRGESRVADDELSIDASWEMEVTLLRFDDWSTWPHLISVLWLVDEAILTLVQEWILNDPALAPSLEKVREEVVHTLGFTREWVQLFLREGAGLQRVVCEVQTALGPALTALLEEFGSIHALEYAQHYQTITGGDC
jgi:1,2-phenylacetyl-CoA epoxidase catalytic subunit